MWRKKRDMSSHMNFIPKTSNNSEFVKKGFETTSLCD